MPRLTRSSGLKGSSSPRMRQAASAVAPPLAYAGERTRLIEEREAIRADITRLPPQSRFRAGLEYRIRQITTRLLALGDEPPPVPGADRKDLQ